MDRKACCLGIFFPPFCLKRLCLGCGTLLPTRTMHRACPISSPPAAGRQAGTIRPACSWACRQRLQAAVLMAALPWVHPGLCSQATVSCRQLGIEITCLGVLCSQKMIEVPKRLGLQTHLLWHRDVPDLALCGYQLLRQ